MNKKNYNVMPQMRYVFNRRNKLNAEGTAVVEVEVLYHRERKWVSTGIKILPKDWDGLRQRVKNRYDMILLNERLEMLQGRMGELFSCCLKNDIEFSFDFVRLVMEGRDVEVILAGQESGRCRNTNFVEWCEERIAEDSKSARSTVENWKVVMRKLREYNDQESRSCQLRFFGDLTGARVKRYAEWMVGNGMAERSANMYLCVVSMFCNRAVDEGLLQANPCKGVKVAAKGDEVIRYILKEDIDRIEALELTGKLEMARDCFLFQCYTGMAYTDAKNFDPARCRIRNGARFYEGKRVKTGQTFQIVLLPKVEAILERWGGRLSYDSATAYNLWLKTIQGMARIETKLSSHVGRHSFAMMCLNNGVRIEVLAKMMGHSNISTTQVYASILGKTVEDAFADLAKKLS